MYDSDAAFFIARGRDDEIPEARKRVGNPYWNWLQPLLTLPAEKFGPVSNDGVSREIAIVREYEARRAAANGPSFAELVSA